MDQEKKTRINYWLEQVSVMISFTELGKTGEGAMIS